MRKETLIRRVHHLALWLAASGIVYSVLTWVLQEAVTNMGHAPSYSAGFAGLLFLIALSLLGESFFPLHSFTKSDWIYRIRPSGGAETLQSSPAIQLVVYAVIGAIVGAATGSAFAVPIFALMALAFRVAFSLHKKRDIPTLLAAGETHLLSQASVVVLDADVISSLTCARHQRWSRKYPTANYCVLVWRRLTRRPYVALVLCAIVLLTLSMSSAVKVYSLFFFVIAWSIAGAEVARCGDFSKVGGARWPKYAVVFIHSLLAVAIVGVIASPSNMVLSALLVISAVMRGGIVRSRPRRVTQFSLVETGIGAPISPEVVSFFTSGLLQPILLTLVFINHAI